MKNINNELIINLKNNPLLIDVSNNDAENYNLGNTNNQNVINAYKEAFYNLKELQEIIERSASILNIKIEKKSFWKS